MVENISIGDELFYLDRTRGIYKCKICGIVETNGCITYRDMNRNTYYPEDLYYNKSDVVEKITTYIKYTNISDLPAGTKDFKYGDKVYFIDVNPYMISDAMLTLVEKSSSSTYEGFTYKFRGCKEGYYSQNIYRPFATLAEATEYIKKEIK